MSNQMKAALNALFELAGFDATPVQILQVAEQFDVEVWQLEGFYVDECDRLSDA